MRRHELHRTHIVETVRQLNNQDANILRHGKKHLSEILRLKFFLGVILDVSQFGHAVYQQSDFFIEILYQLFSSVLRVLHHIVKEPGDDRFIIHAKTGQNLGDRNRVNDIRFSALSHLAVMKSVGDFKGLDNHRIIVSLVHRLEIFNILFCCHTIISRHP